MPHMSSGGSEDFYSTDEVKVYKDEGNKDEEKRSSENLTEEKLGLVTESEEVSLSSNKCRAFDLLPRSGWPWFQAIIVISFLLHRIMTYNDELKLKQF